MPATRDMFFVPRLKLQTFPCNSQMPATRTCLLKHHMDSTKSRNNLLIVSEQANPAVQHTAFYAQYRTHDSMELLSA